jgi:lipopolysaccharide exporter
LQLVSTLKGFLLRNTSVVLISNVGSLFLRLVSTLVLTRLLDASAFGIVGVMTSVAQIITLISNVGMFAFVVRSGHIEEKQFLDEVWTFKLVRGFAQTAIIAALAIPLSHILGKPDLAAPIAVGGLLLLGDAASSMAFATAAHQGRIQRLAVMDLIPLAFQIIVSILLAVWLRSVWAILIALLASAALKAILSYTLFPNAARHWQWSRDRARDIWAFGKSITGSSLIQLALSQVDKLIFARLFTLPQFGLYMLSVSLAEMPGAFTGNYTSRILFPIFSRARHLEPQDVKATYYDAGRNLRLLYMFAAGGFIATANLIIMLLYDPRYAGAAVYLQVLAIGALFKLPTAVAGEFLIALGETGHYLRSNLARIVTLLFAGVAGYITYGPLGLVMALVAAEGAALLYCWWALRVVNVFEFQKELLFFMPAAVGYAVGFGASRLIGHLIP